ncbi:lamin-B2-like [Narcine bancroftii]|uniref:lamin-B2-like n=1 Tax=Narcine bancroftii TaxID=1343680 RepID=UPI003831A85E
MQWVKFCWNNKMANCESNDRISEKAQLRELNERFCHYIQNMKCLTDQQGTNDNSNDLKRIQELEDEMVAARNLYNKEIQALHDQLDANCKERMQIEVNNLKNSQLIADFRESVLALNTAILQKEEEKKCLELMLGQRETELKEVQMSVGKPAKELDELRREVQRLHSCLEEVQKRYEKEQKQTLELQATIQQLRCKLALQQDNHCQDMACTREKAAEAEALIQELEVKLRRASVEDGGAMEMLRKIRAANNAEMQQYRQRTEQNYNESVLDLTLCLNKERIQSEQIQEQNQCLRQHINSMTMEIKTLQDKLLSEEENKVALANKLDCEHQKSQYHINELKARLEEVEDLLLAKMKELHSKSGAVMPSLQGDIATFKCMLEAEERRLGTSLASCYKRTSPSKSHLLRPWTTCTPSSHFLCRQASAASSCPPGILRPCLPPPIPNPCPAPTSWALPVTTCGPPPSAPSSRLSACQPNCPLPHSLTSCLASIRPLSSSPSARLSCMATRPVTPTCLPLAQRSCLSSSPLSLIQSQCPMTPALNSSPPANTSSNCNPPSNQSCSMSSLAYPKPCPLPEAPRFKHEQCLATECCNGETQKVGTKPPTKPLKSCRPGQGSDYFNSMLGELNKNSTCSRFPASNSLMTVCNLNAPNCSTTGNIKITEVAANGHFVRLLNISHDVEEDIGNHTLQQNIGGYPVTTFRFPPRTRLLAGSGVTVWAAGAKVPHNPPTDFLWKECSQFATGPECTTILCKPNGQAVTWFTPAPGHLARKNPCRNAEKFGEGNHQVPTNDFQCRSYPDLEKERTTSDACHIPPTVSSMKETTPFLHLPVRSPWTQSTSCITHPDFNIPRTQSMGNEGYSQCRNSRSQSGQPDPLPGTAATASCRKSSSNSRRLSTSLENRSRQRKTIAPGPLQSSIQETCTPLQHLQSRQNLEFQPPMPRPHPIASW